MVKYFVEGTYTAEGTKGLIKEGGSNRLAAYAKACESVGGKVEAFYFVSGENKTVSIVNAPDKISAHSLLLLTISTGTATVKITELLTPAEVDAAVKKHPSYRPAGN